MHYKSLKIMIGKKGYFSFFWMSKIVLIISLLAIKAQEHRVGEVSFLDLAKQSLLQKTTFGCTKEKGISFLFWARKEMHY